MSDMQHDDRDLDAAEYVLGTLSPEAARDMAERMAREPELARAVADWETRLARFGEDLAPVEPPAHVWQAISDDLSMTRPTGRGDIREAANDSALRRWRIAAVAASTAAILLAGALWLGGPTGGPGEAAAQPTYASMIYDQPTGMSWLIHSAGQDDNALAVEALQNYDVPEGKALRMYVRGPGGEASLVGDLPHAPGKYTMDLSNSAREMMARNSEIVVAMEDAGQTASQPNGRIMWVSPIALRRG